MHRAAVMGAVAAALAILPVSCGSTTSGGVSFGGGGSGFAGGSSTSGGSGGCASSADCLPGEVCCDFSPGFAGGATCQTGPCKTGQSQLCAISAECLQAGTVCSMPQPSPGSGAVSSAMTCSLAAPESGTTAEPDASAADSADAVESSTADAAETGAAPGCSVPLQTSDCCVDGICSRCPATADDLAAVFCPLDPVGATTRAPDSGRVALVWWANLTTVPCDGLLVAAVGDGVDCTEYFFFDATTRALVAAGQWGYCGNLCGATTTSFQWPSACAPGPGDRQRGDLPDGSVPVPVCPDAG